MALYAFDGTWSCPHDNPQEDTNVVHFRDAYESGEVAYFSGPGTRMGWLGRIAGGLTGAGGHHRVREALKAVERNIDNGDSVIDVIGFSRGAALALDFANSLPACVRVRFLGMWDTVPSFGLPGSSFDIGWKLDLPLAADHCFHGMALDETRYNYPLHRLAPNRRLSQVWFRGRHSDVGGGNGNVGLSSITLDWMFEAAHLCGLRLKTWKVMENRARMNPGAAISHLAFETKLRPRVIEPGDVVHRTVRLAKSGSGNEPQKAA
jgi:uncharacterized protein (DUF2235 family)